MKIKLLLFLSLVDFEGKSCEQILSLKNINFHLWCDICDLIMFLKTIKFWT